MYNSHHLNNGLFQIDRKFSESFWSIPIIFYLFGAALVFLHPETRVLAWTLFRRTFAFFLVTIILIEQLTNNNVMVEAIKRNMTSTVSSEVSNVTVNISTMEVHAVIISNIGDPLEWDEILIVLLLFLIALILFIVGMCMVDRVQHGKDRSFRKYINERNKPSKKGRKFKKMKSIEGQSIKPDRSDTIVESTLTSFVENPTLRGKILSNSPMSDVIR